MPIRRLRDGAVVAFLWSDAAEWINGQVWAIDGGNNMRA